MRPEAYDQAYLADMANAAEELIQLTRGVTFEQYLRTRTLILSAERLIEIIGEAARHVSRPFQDAHPGIPWQAIVAQRHVLAHDYGEIDQRRIWRVAQVYAPDLLSRLRPLLQTPPIN